MCGSSCNSDLTTALYSSDISPNRFSGKSNFLLRVTPYQGHTLLEPYPDVIFL